jgi:hypothetical protein
MLKKLPLLLVVLALAVPSFAGEKPCPKGESRGYSCAPGTGPGSQGDKPCKKVYSKTCAPIPPPPK